MKHTTATTTQNLTPNTVAVCTLATAYFAMFGLRIGIKYVLRMKGLNNAVLTWNICFFFPEWLERIKLLQTEWAVGTEKKIKVIQTKITQSTVEAGTTHITRVSEYSRSMKSGKCDTFRENYWLFYFQFSRYGALKMRHIKIYFIRDVWVILNK